MKSGWHNLQGKPGDIKRQFHECSSRSPVGLVCTEELSLSLHRRPDVFVALDVSLAPVHNANVTCAERQAVIELLTTDFSWRIVCMVWQPAL